MNRYTLLKRGRVIISLLLLFLITLSFIVSSSLSYSFISKILKIEFIPSLLSIMSGGAITFLFITLLTLLFGRLYCSTLCPLGIYQDIVINVANRIKPKRKRKFYFEKGRKIRYYIVASLLLAFAVGWLSPLTILEPYSIWGRVSNTFIVRGAISLHNLMASIFPATLYIKSFSSITLSTLLLASTLLITVTLLSIFKGRLYCNIICPVGTLLGMLSKFSLYKPTIEEEACISCYRCSIVCKANCIDIESKSIDSSRCILCFNCMVSCPKGGIGLSSSLLKGGSKSSKRELSLERRRVLLGLGAAGGAIATNFALKRPLLASTPGKSGIAPPGAISVNHLKLNCTACHACVAACPATIIKPSLGEYGFDAPFLPLLNFDNHYCSFECTRCSEVCPNGALLPLTKEKKQITAIAKAKFSLRECIVYTDKTDCGACEEHCPTKAINMVSYKGTALMIPHINKKECIGCGACQYICPATPIKAMKVVALQEHQEITPRKEQKEEKKEIESFGF